MINPFIYDGLSYPAGRLIDYDPDITQYDGLLNMGTIPIVYDKSGNNYDGNVANPLYSPEISLAERIDGHRTFFFRNDSIGFNTTNQYYWILPDLSPLSSGEAFVIAKHNYDPTTLNELGSGIWNFGVHSAPNSIPYKDGNIYDDFGSDTRHSFSSGGNSNYNNKWFVYSVKSSFNDRKAYRNGTEISAITSNNVGFSSSPTLGHSNPTGIYYFSGWIARFIFFSPALSDNESISFANQLKTKYGIV